MKNDKLLLILIILVGFGVLIDLVNTIGLALLAYEVKPLISKVDSKMDSLEMPDFSSVNELMSKFEPFLELADELNDPIINYYFDEFRGFLQRFDDVQGANRVIWKVGTWNESVNDGGSEYS